MVDVKNLNRVKGILSAKQGAEIPKFQQGAKFAKYNGQQIIYSHDNANWFTDYNLKNAYTGSLTGFKSIAVPAPGTMIVPGSIPSQGNPYAAIETAASINANIESNKQQQMAEQVATSINVTEKVNQPQSTPAVNSLSEVAKVQPVKSTASVNFRTPTEQLYEQTKSGGINIVDTTTSGTSQLSQKNLTTSAIGQAGVDTFNAVGDVVKSKQATTDSNLTQGLDATYDATASTLQSAGGIAGMVGSVMKIAGTAGDVLQELGGGTDQQTTTDKWMDSAFFSWNVGAINGFFGKKANKFGADTSILEAAGSSYGDTTNDILNAAEKSGKKYGLFSSKERKRVNAAAKKAELKQNTLGDITGTAADQRLAAQSMGEQAGLAYSFMTGGDYGQKYTYSAKHGGILEWEPDIRLEWEPQIELNWELPAFKEGGNIDINEELEWIPELQSGNKIRTIEELVEYAKQKNPRFIQRLSEEPRGIKFKDDKGNESEGSHYLESRGEYVIPRIQEINGELKFLSPQEAIDRAMESDNYLEMTPEEAVLFAEKYKQGWPDFFEKFKKGGSVGNSDVPEIEETTQKNVIPEGALHKNKHHMEHAEGLTKKGIPVIDDDGEQQAEIEHSEIIFTLEVTKKLEEYYEIFYSDESSNKEKEQAALDVGKLLVYQILENTEDRTGLIDSCKKGGTLTLKKTADDLIEEILEDVSTIVIVEEEEIVKTPKKKEEKLDKETMKEAIKEALVELLIK